MNANDMSLAVVQVLFKYLILAAVFESAFTAIFSWRWFIKRFTNKGLKTPIMLISSLLIFMYYRLDIVAEITSIFDGVTNSISFSGMLLTAFFIAGGSSSVNNVLKIWKIRDTDTRVEKVMKEEQAKVSENIDKKNLLIQAIDEIKKDSIQNSNPDFIAKEKVAIEVLESLTSTAPIH